MTARPVLAVLLCLLLAACWVGKPFYGPGETRAPIPPGDYRSTGFDGEASKDEERVRISIGADGLTRFDSRDKEEKPSVMGFASLDRSETWFVGWMWVGDEPRKPDDDLAYFLLARVEDGFRLFMPNCDENRDLAVAAGAVVEPDKKAALCRFADRASLEAAMRAAKDKLHAGVKLVPVATQSLR